MKQILSILTIALFSMVCQAENLNDPTTEAGIEIAPTVENNYLDIEVDEEFSGASFTVSVFSSLGEIVYQGQLGIGLNKIDVTKMEKGQYTAVVRKDGEYTSKQSFTVS